MFDLTIPLSADAVDGMKSTLTNSMPTVKSSHRCEALARGLGLRTYAALRARVASSGGASATADGHAFVSYLEEHGFEASAVPFYQACAIQALRNVCERVPQLTARGMGLGEPDRNDKAVGGYQAEFDHVRDELFHDRYVESFLRSLCLVALIPATKTIRSAGSYRLKHIAENLTCSYPTGEELGPDYVPNGALIAAAVHQGFQYKTFNTMRGYLSLNVSFNMSKPVIDDLDCELRPTGGFASDRRRRSKQRRSRRYGLVA